MPSTRSAVIACATLAALSAPVQAQTVADSALVVQTVATGLAQPTGMAFLGDGDILVIQKANGQVRRILNGQLQAAPVLDVAVDSASERGLLGIAVDPEFAANRRVFLYYTESSTGADTNGVTPAGNRVYRYTWNGTALTSPVLVLNLPATPGPNHDGGVLAFGPDRALYAVIGDLNRNGKLQNFAGGANPDDCGVILRVDADGGGLPDNPLRDPSDPASPLRRYFAYGVRNSFGLGFDPVTGALWDTENGPNAYDEINRVVPGFNSGWEAIMGPDARDPQGLADLWVAPGSTYRDPEFSWAVPVAPAALVFVASPRLGCGLWGDLLVGDNNCGQLYRFELNAARDALVMPTPELADRVADNGGATCSREMGGILLGSGWGVVTDLENGPDGLLYALSLTQGAVYRIAPRTGALPDADADGAPDACDCAPADASAFAPPAEVRGVRAAGPAAAFDWIGQASSAGTGTTYAVATGDAAALRRDGGFIGACMLADRLAAPAFADARPDPPVGSAVWYLVRAANVCDAGTWGDSGLTPDPRDLIDASPPPACDGSARTGG